MYEIRGFLCFYIQEKFICFFVEVLSFLVYWGVNEIFRNFQSKILWEFVKNFVQFKKFVNFWSLFSFMINTDFKKWVCGIIELKLCQIQSNRSKINQKLSSKGKNWICWFKFADVINDGKNQELSGFKRFNSLKILKNIK